MRNFVVILLIASAAMTHGALAASPKSAPAKALNAPAGPSPANAPQTQKRAACERTWKAQTKHTGKHKAFIAACVAKG